MVPAGTDLAARTGRLVGSEAHPKIPSVDMEGTLGCTNWFQTHPSLALPLASSGPCDRSGGRGVQVQTRIVWNLSGS